MNEREDLKAYLDGELPASRTEEVRVALEHDPDLREEYTFMKLLTKEIQDTAKEPEVKGVDAVRKVIKRRPWFLRPPALIVQGIAALLIVGIIGHKIAPDLTGTEAKTVAFSADRAPSADMAKSPAMAKKAPSGAADSTAASPPVAVPTERGDDFRQGQSAGGAIVEGESKSKDADSRSPAYSIGNGAILGQPSIGMPSYAPRDVVKTGNLGVQVKDTKQAMQEVTDTVKAMQGYVESSNVSNYNGGASGNMTLRVPATSFETLVNSVRRMGEVTSEALNGQDVTAPLADMQAREKVLKAEENSYVEMLRQTRKLQDILDLRDRLSNVRQEIKSIDAQRKSLAAVASLSTLSVTFTEPTKIADLKPKDWFGETTNGATNALMSVGQTIISGALYVAILSPIWAPVALVAWWISRRRKMA